MKVCKGLCCCLAVAALAGIVVSVATAVPPMKQADVTLQDQSSWLMKPIKPSSYGQTQSTGFPVCESTGWEAVEALCTWEAGFGVCGDDFICSNLLVPPNPAQYPATCTPATGPPELDNCCFSKPNYDTEWYMSASAQQCYEPHVDTINPSSGTQHLRFAKSTLGGNPSGCVGFGGACRQSAISPNSNPAFPAEYPAGITTASFDVARPSPGIDLSGMQMQWLPLGDGTAVATGAFAYWVVNIDAAGYANGRDPFLGAYVYIGAVAGSGYHEIKLVFDKCNNLATYYFDGVPKYSTGTSTVLAGGFDWFFFAANNSNGEIDIDNFEVDRVMPCPPAVCGNGDIEQYDGEECDNGAPPNDDTCCPGLCIPEGEEGECTCVRDNSIFDCTSRELVNGTSGPFLTDGGFYSYTADAPFTSVDTCTSNYDTEIYWNISPDCSLYELYNDECNGETFAGTQDVGDPNAPCYVATGNAVGNDSCLCMATPPATYTFIVGEFGGSFQPPACSNTVVHITKKTSCALGGPIPGGACCDTITGDCTDGEEAAACQGQYLVYTDNKTCDLVECDPIEGACCNTAPGAGGACIQTISADCPTSEYQSWTPGALCDHLECDEVTGSCCNSLTGVCTPNVIQSACNCGSDCSWDEGGSCPGQCVAATGACCVEPDPLHADCTEGQTLAQCNAAGGVWTRGAACDDSSVECNPNFIPIPTVSEWGLAVLALLLLIGGKIYFSRREAAMA